MKEEKESGYTQYGDAEGGTAVYVKHGGRL